MINSLLCKQLRGYHAEAILDIGPGYSHFARLAAQLTGAWRIAYMDCNPEVLFWQKKECETAGVTAILHQVNLSEEGLTSIDGKFDLILCQEVLEHLQTPVAVLKAIQERLRPKGWVVLTVPTKRSERWLKRINPSYMRDVPYGHIQDFSEEDLRELAERAGFSVRIFLPAQPHYFIIHTWIYGSRMRVEGSTGKILDRGVRYFLGNIIFSLTKKIFKVTGGMEWWAKLLPRNYFLIIEKK